MKLVLALIILFVSNIAIADSKIAAAIKQNILDSIKYAQSENIDKSMSTMHSQSPSYMPTKDMMSRVFGSYKLSYELRDFKYVAYDGDLAYVRIKQVTKKVSGPSFQNNIIDAVQIFRQESGVWKLWSQTNIEIKYID